MRIQKGFTQTRTFVSTKNLVKMKLEGGFTLIELLVVIAIIGVLSTIAMASFNNAQMKARDSQRRSDLSQIKSALELARSDDAYNRYPYSLSAPIVTDFTTLQAFLQAPRSYMKNVPDDPRYGHYFYLPAIDGSDYTLIACLENANDPKKDAAKYAGCSLTGQAASVSFTAP